MDEGFDTRRDKAVIFEQPSALRRRIGEVTNREASSKPNIFEDTSDFMSIGAGDVLRLADNDYLVKGHAREGRFGIDDQPKFWVKSCIDLTSCARKIVKLVFRETFDCRIGSLVCQCSRSAEKESAVLQTMREHPNFMHGQSVRDAAGNLVRIIDFVTGPSLYEYLRGQEMSHEEYYRREFAKVMRRFIGCIEAIARLHEQGLHHGDIRADHVIVNDKTDTYVWIDFDYEVSDLITYDLLCLGNVLQQVVGKGRHSLDDIRLRPSDYPDFNNALSSSDMSLMFRHRVTNLRRLYPYLSEVLNEILMRFSVGTTDPYKNVGSLLEDLRLLFPS